MAQQNVAQVVVGAWAHRPLSQPFTSMPRALPHPGGVVTPRGRNGDATARKKSLCDPLGCTQGMRNACRLAACVLGIVALALGAIVCLVLTLVADSYTLDS